MKKQLLIFFTGILMTFTSMSQSNIGIIIGGGVSDFRIRTDSIAGDKILNKEDLNFRIMYQAGFNFENILIERQLYLQFGLQARSSGYSSHNDSIGMYFHTIHIPLEIKYKYFFDRRGEGYVYGSAGPYASASYRGIQYNYEAVDNFLADTNGNLEMYNPRIKLGKSSSDDIMAFDYGVNAGFGFGYSNFQIGYNFGLGFANMVPKALSEAESSKLLLRNGYHSVTLGFYFSNK
ncbi:MAG: PorT family protein [Bacteroidales bacterium]|nr:PorT family protein [Bacteroidales bacterium]